LFSHYPEHLVAEAIDAVNGLPGECDFLPTIAKVKSFLEPRWQEMVRKQDMQERFNRKRLPEPPANPEREARIAQGLMDLAAQLKSGFGPSSA